MPKIDLHIHSYYSSDGDYSPEELLQMAAEKKLKAIAICDHDSLKAVPEALEQARNYAVEVIPGVEISTTYKGFDLHILGLFVDHSNPALQERLTQIQESYNQYLLDILTKVNKLGFLVEYEEVKALCPRAVPVPGFIGKAILTNGKNEGNPALETYRSGPRSDQPYFNFYLDYFRKGKAAFVSRKNGLPSETAIGEIKQAGGIPLLAHPGGSLKLDTQFEVIEDLRKAGLMGLEVYSSYHDHKTETLLQTYCTENGLLASSGSDYHGPSMKPEIKMGAISYNEFELLDKMRASLSVFQGKGL